MVSGASYKVAAEPVIRYTEECQAGGGAVVSGASPVKAPGGMAATSGDATAQVRQRLT